ncbi:hypothetical protein IC575_002250 [Cucumis melo]
MTVYHKSHPHSFFKKDLNQILNLTAKFPKYSKLRFFFYLIKNLHIFRTILYIKIRN